MGILVATVAIVVLGGLAAVSASVWSYVRKEREGRQKAEAEKAEAIDMKEKILSLAKVNNKRKKEADMVAYLEKSNAKLGSVVSRLEAVQTQNRDLKDRADSIRTMEMENASLLKDAKHGDELKEQNASMKLNISKIDELQKENESLLQQYEKVEETRKRNRELQMEVARKGIVDAEYKKLDASFKELRAAERRTVAKRDIQKKCIEDAKNQKEELEKEALHLDGLEEKNAALKVVVGKVQSLAKENASLEAEAGKQEKIAAENAHLRSIAEKVCTLEAENEKLEEAILQLKELQDENDDLKAAVDFDSLVLLHKENAQLKQQALLTTRLETEISLLKDRAQNVDQMEGEAKELREKAGRLEEVSAYHMALLDCASKVEKLEIANKHLEKKAKDLTRLQNRNEQLSHQLNAAQSQVALPTKVPMGVSEACDQVDRELTALKEENFILKEKKNSVWRLKAENKLLKLQVQDVDKLMHESFLLREKARGIFRLQAEIKLLKGQVAGVEKAKETKRELEDCLNDGNGDSLAPLQAQNREMKHKVVVLRKYKQENESLKAKVLALEDEEAKNSSLKSQLAKMHRLQAENSKLEGNAPAGITEISSEMKKRIATRRPSNENIWMGDEIESSPITSSIRAPSSLPLELDTTVIPAGDSTTKALHALDCGERNLSSALSDTMLYNHALSMLGEESAASSDFSTSEDTLPLSKNAPPSLSNSSEGRTSIIHAVKQAKGWKNPFGLFKQHPQDRNVSEALGSRPLSPDPFLIAEGLESFGMRLVGSSTPVSE